jgi:hypothetical protein
MVDYYTNDNQLDDLILKLTIEQDY